MAYNFLNTTTYSNDPLAQGDFEQFIPSSQSTPLGAGIDDTPFESDLIEMVATAEEDPIAPTQEIETPSVEEQEEADPQVDWELMNMIFQEEPAATPTQRRTYTPPPSVEDDEDEPAPTPRTGGKVKPRIWQNGGQVSKYQTGGQPDQSLSTALFEMLEIPQRGLMKLLTGSTKKPSERLQESGYTNKWVGLAADMATDPLAFLPFSKARGLKTGAALTTGQKIKNAALFTTNTAADLHDIKQTATKQFGGHLNAETYEQQRIGLNDPNYNSAVFNTKGTNTFRGLDSYEPVAITDGSKYKVLYGPEDTAQFSGKVYEQKLKMQFGGELKPETNEVKEFYQNYLNSPNYLDRLKRHGYVNPNQVILDRIANMKAVTTNVDDVISSQYNAPNYTVFYNPKEAEEYGFPMQSVLSHEYAHTIGASQGRYLKNPNLELNSSEEYAISKRNKLNANRNPRLEFTPLNVDVTKMTAQELDDLHDSRVSESKADLDALRFRLYKDKIFDTGTQQFNPELLKQAKEKYKDDNIVNRLFKNFSDEDLIYLMNNIAYNNTNNNRPVYG